MTFQIDGLALAARQPDGQVSVYELSDGSLFPVAPPPSLADGTYGPEVQEAARIVREALGQLAGVDGQRRAVTADESLSDTGRRQKVEAVRQVARVGLEMARAELERLKADTDRRTATFYDPPALEAGDLAGALIDREIRDHARGLSGEALSRYVASLETNPRHLVAIARSPTSMPGLSDPAIQAWREGVAARHPQAGALARSGEAVRWAQELLPHIEARL